MIYFSATDKAYNKARILADNDETAAITSGPGGTSDGGPGVTTSDYTGSAINPATGETMILLLPSLMKD